MMSFDLASLPPLVGEGPSGRYIGAVGERKGDGERKETAYVY